MFSEKSILLAVALFLKYKWASFYDIYFFLTVELAYYWSEGFPSCLQNSGLFLQEWLFTFTRMKVDPY